MKLGGLQKVSLIDFPGKVACTLFISSCPFRCPFCYSPELVLPEKIKDHPRIPEEYFFDFLRERKGLLDGVCLTGGEPTMSPDLPKLIRDIKQLGYDLKLDTNGSNPLMLKELIAENLVDYLAMDIKAPLKCSGQSAENYNKATGLAKIDLEQVKESIGIIKNSGVDYEFRMTVVPALHTREDIIQVARDIAPADKLFLQNFRPEKTLDPLFEKIKPYPEEDLLSVQKEIASLFGKCEVRG